jgi:hypothetical protein
MHAMAKAVAAGAGALLLSAYASGEDEAFTRKSTSQATLRQDSAACWRLAQRSKLTDDEAMQNLITGYLIGGVVGVLIVASENEEANKSPKSAYRRQVHDACMAKRGYSKKE